MVLENTKRKYLLMKNPFLLKKQGSQ